MHVLITARHLNLKPQTKAYAEQKASKLLKYYDLIQEIEVTIDQAERNGFHAEMIVNAEHRNMFVANAREATIEACIDACHDKLERQLSEHKARHRNRKHPEAGALHTAHGLTCYAQAAMTLAQLVQHEAVLPQLTAADRDSAIRELIAALAQCGVVQSDDAASLAKAAIDREKKGSTGFGKGVAIPHVKHKCVPKPVAALGISTNGIDFRSLDSQPVYSVILLLSPDNADQHLAAMNVIWPKLNNDRFRKFLRQARSRQEIIDLLLESQSM